MKKKYKEDLFDEKKIKPKKKADKQIKKKPGQWMEDEEFFMKENSLHWEHDFREDTDDDEDDFFPKRDDDDDLWDNLDK